MSLQIQKNLWKKNFYGWLLRKKYKHNWITLKAFVDNTNFYRRIPKQFFKNPKDLKAMSFYSDSPISIDMCAFTTKRKCLRGVRANTSSAKLIKINYSEFKSAHDKFKLDYNNLIVFNKSISHTPIKKSDHPDNIYSNYAHCEVNLNVITSSSKETAKLKRQYSKIIIEILKTNHPYILD